jgi:hypothetical protein
MRAAALGVLLCGCGTWIQDNPAFTDAETSSSPTTDTATSSTDSPCDEIDEPNDVLSQAVEVPAPALDGGPSSIQSSLGPDDIDWFSFETDLESGHRYSATTSGQLCTCLVPRCVDGLVEDLPGCPGRMSPEGYEDELDGYIACCAKDGMLGRQVGIECSSGTRIRINIAVVGGTLAAQKCGDQFVPANACVPYELGYQSVTP